MPHSKGLQLTINRDRLLNAPVPTENQDLSADLPEPEDETIQADVTEEEVASVEEGEDNQNLIDMGVAFPKGAASPDSVSRHEREDEDEEQMRIAEEEEEASRGIFI
jgi:hypothetical protein